jgi:RecJ-like exonuclease
MNKNKVLEMYKKNCAMDDININSIHLEQVKSLKYLGSIVNGNNSIEEEIKERIILANKAFYANQALFKSKLLSKKAKLKIYWTLASDNIRL